MCIKYRVVRGKRSHGGTRGRNRHGVIKRVVEAEEWQIVRLHLLVSFFSFFFFLFNTRGIFGNAVDEEELGIWFLVWIEGGGFLFPFSNSIDRSSGRRLGVWWQVG